jgi:hypothetical protein
MHTFDQLHWHLFLDALPVRLVVESHPAAWG